MHDTDLGPGRPDADECLPYYFTYIDLVPDGHLMKLLERQISESASFLTVFTPEQALWREAPGGVERHRDRRAPGRYRARLRAFRIVRADPVMWTEVEFPSYAAAANFQARMLGDVVAEYAGNARS